MHTITKQSDRYPGLAPEWPDSFTINGLSDELAEELAAQMSNFYPGCDYIFYCKEAEEKV